MRVGAASQRKPVMTDKEWNDLILTRYNARKAAAEERLGVDKLTAAQLREVFADEFKWHEQHRGALADALLTDGAMEGQIDDLLRPIIAISQRIHDQHGIHVFGYAIQTKHDAKNRSLSCVWGPEGEYEQVLQQYPRNLREPTAEFEAIFRVIEMVNKGQSQSIAKQGLALDYRKEGRDGNRILVKAFYGGLE
ncbi:hypothetical protein AAF712_014110 [Marasmius tenuissimus]|uniref:Uncharacterized protein n=1 Tax=Marasmius tenuissimus TaxID=585030 RepID=A0ABR2ZCW4_9AGAR